MDNNLVNFDFEEFCEYVKKRMSCIIKHEGKWKIICDTQPLSEIAPDALTEKEALTYIFENRLFEKLEKYLK